MWVVTEKQRGFPIAIYEDIYDIPFYLRELGFYFYEFEVRKVNEFPVGYRQAAKGHRGGANGEVNADGLIWLEDFTQGKADD